MRNSAQPVLSQWATVTSQEPSSNIPPLTPVTMTFLPWWIISLQTSSWNRCLLPWLRWEPNRIAKRNVYCHERYSNSQIKERNKSCCYTALSHYCTISSNNFITKSLWHDRKLTNTTKLPFRIIYLCHLTKMHKSDLGFLTTYMVLFNSHIVGAPRQLSRPLLKGPESLSPKIHPQVQLLTTSYWGWESSIQIWEEGGQTHIQTLKLLFLKMLRCICWMLSTLKVVLCMKISYGLHWHHSNPHLWGSYIQRPPMDAKTWVHIHCGSFLYTNPEIEFNPEMKQSACWNWQ